MTDKTASTRVWWMVDVSLLRYYIRDCKTHTDYLKRPYHAIVGPGLSPAKDSSVSSQARGRHRNRPPKAKPDHGDDGRANRLGQIHLSEGREGRSVGFDGLIRDGALRTRVRRRDRRYRRPAS